MPMGVVEALGLPLGTDEHPLRPPVAGVIPITAHGPPSPAGLPAVRQLEPLGAGPVDAHVVRLDPGLEEPGRRSPAGVTSW